MTFDFYLDIFERSINFAWAVVSGLWVATLGINLAQFIVAMVISIIAWSAIVGRR